MVFSTMEWIPGDIIGQGNFSTVRLAKPKKKHTSRFPPLMAVKSCNITHADMILHEKSILDELKHCPHIIRCFGNDHTKENGKKMFNLLLEYASGGTLADKLNKQPNCGFQETEVRRYTKCLLEGVSSIHKNGYVHRDLKPGNILLCSSDSKEILKIADFGLAKKSGERPKGENPEFGGTLLYFSPEALCMTEQEAPSDVWAVGCVVAEMFSGAPVWRCRPGEDKKALLVRVALGEEIPKFSKELSAEGRDFLGKIFVKNPAKRWTAQMLLDHPFVAGQTCEEASTAVCVSPRGPLDRSSDRYETSSLVTESSHRISIVEKFRRLVTCQGHCDVVVG